MIDQLHRTISLDNIPTRIVSIVPSQSELLYDLGLRDEVVGITKFCIHPDVWFKSKVRVGGTKNVNIEKIITLAPDLIIANKEENLKEDIEILEKLFPVWVSDIQSLEDSFEMIKSIGELVKRSAQAQTIIENIKNQKSKFKTNTLRKALYFVWYNPWMLAGNDTFINEMMQLAGFENCLQQDRYPILTSQEIKEFSPEVVLLSSEPFPFKEKHIQELVEILPNTKIILVDGELFSWYGSRLFHSFDYFRVLNEQIQNS